MHIWQDKTRDADTDTEVAEPMPKATINNASATRVPAWTEAMGDQLPPSLVLTANQSENQQEQVQATSSTSTSATPAQVTSDAGATTTPEPTSDASSATTTSTSTMNDPAVPARNVIVANCPMPSSVPGTAPPKKEMPVLPTLNPARFGGDAQVETFAKELSDFHAGRIVQDEVDKLYQEAIAQARKQAEAQGKIDTQKAIEEAVADVEDKKNKSAIAKARKAATEQAKRDVQQKIKEALAAVKKHDVASVQAELQSKLEDELATDFQLTMQGALGRFGAGWRAAMANRLNRERAKLEKELKARPKVKKGETPPPQRPSEEIDAEIEARLTQKRCEESAWVANQLEGINHGWMVGKREEVFFKTVKQNVKALGKDFKPPRDVSPEELVQIPQDLKSGSEAMPGVAPEVVAFLLKLQKLEPNFKVGNYAGHGGGSWAGKGYSLDLYLSGKNAQKDERGFWQHDAAVLFLLNLDRAAKAVGAQWRVLYNDFSVAEEVNRTTGVRNVTFMGSPLEGKNLNWHGPDPLILHFHLDIAPSASFAQPNTKQ